MNNEPRDITIENAAFSLVIHWNPNAVLMQVGILVACILCIKFVDNAALKTLAKVLLAIDVVSLFIGIFVLGKKGKDDENGSKKTGVSESKKEVTDQRPVEVTSSQTGHSSVTTTDGTIKNKLNIATPQLHPKQVEVPLEVDSAPVIEPVKEPTAEPQPMVIPDDIRNAFSDFFDMDLDDE